MADDRVVLGAEPARSLGGPAGEVGADSVDQQQVKEPVQDGFLADIATRNLIGEQAKDWRLPFIAAEHQLRGQRVEQSSRDLTPQVVGTGQDLGGAVGRVAPAAHPERAHLRDVLTIGSCAALAGVDDRLRRRGRVVGEQVVIGAAQERDIPGAEPLRRLAVDGEAGVAAQHRDHAQRRLVLDAQRPTADPSCSARGKHAARVARRAVRRSHPR